MAEHELGQAATAREKQEIRHRIAFLKANQEAAEKRAENAREIVLRNEAKRLGKR